jgi:hypothetical protein
MLLIFATLAVVASLAGSPYQESARMVTFGGAWSRGGTPHV